MFVFAFLGVLDSLVGAFPSNAGEMFLGDGTIAKGTTGFRSFYLGENIEFIRFQLHVTTLLIQSRGGLSLPL